VAKDKVSRMHIYGHSKGLSSGLRVTRGRPVFAAAGTQRRKTTGPSCLLYREQRENSTTRALLRVGSRTSGARLSCSVNCLSSGELERPQRPENIPEATSEQDVIPDVVSPSAVPTPVPTNTLYEADPKAVEADLVKARELLASEKKVYVTVLRLNKAGLVCKFSELLECFIPVAQLSSYTRQFYREEWQDFGKGKSKSLIGESIGCCVIGVRDQEELQKHMVVMSEIKAEEREAAEVFDITQRGDVVECYVKTITHFGVFVKLGAIDALIHKSQIWLPEMEEEGEDIMIDETKLSSVFSLGDRLQAVVIKIDREKGQISLSMKALVPNRSNLTLSEIAQEMKSITTKTEGWAIPEMVKMCSNLEAMEDIDEIIAGPCVKSGAVAPDFQVLLSSKEIEGGYEVFARKGFQVQEAQVRTALGRTELKALLQSVSAQVL